MFLDNLSQFKRVTLFKYLEKWDFTGYDFSIESYNIKNWKDLLEFLWLFVKYKCFDKNLEILNLFVNNIYKDKSIIILYEAYLINTDPYIEDIIWNYKNIVSKESFEFKKVIDLLEKTREILNCNKSIIIIYNAINNNLWFKDDKIYFNFLLELLELKNNWYFKEINLIFNLLEYSSNRSLSYQIKEVAYYLEHEYNIDNIKAKKYIYSISKKLIKNFSEENIDYKNIFIKNMLNYIWKNEFYKEFFINNTNIKLKELLFWILIWTLNKNNITVEEIKKDIKNKLIEDKRQVNNIVNDLRENIDYIEEDSSASYADYIIDKI